MADLIPRRLDLRAPKLVCGLLKQVAVILTFLKKINVKPRPLLTTLTQGGGGGGGSRKKKLKTSISQLRALATHTPILGRVGQGALELGLPQIR